MFAPVSHFSFLEGQLGEMLVIRSLARRIVHARFTFYGVIAVFIKICFKTKYQGGVLM